MCFIAENDWTPTMEMKKRGEAMSKQERAGSYLATKLVPGNGKKQELSHLDALEGTRPGKHLEFRF